MSGNDQLSIHRCHYLEHVGGTKAYAICVTKKDVGNSGVGTLETLISWGKIGRMNAPRPSFGQNSETAAEILRVKISRGYIARPHGIYSICHRIGLSCGSGGEEAIKQQLVDLLATKGRSTSMVVTLASLRDKLDPSDPDYADLHQRTNERLMKLLR